MHPANYLSAHPYSFSAFPRNTILALHNERPCNQHRHPERSEGSLPAQNASGKLLLRSPYHRRRNKHRHPERIRLGCAKDLYLPTLHPVNYLFAHPYSFSAFPRNTILALHNERPCNQHRHPERIRLGCAKDLYLPTLHPANYFSAHPYSFSAFPRNTIRASSSARDREISPSSIIPVSAIASAARAE